MCRVYVPFITKKLTRKLNFLTNHTRIVLLLSTSFAENLPTRQQLRAPCPLISATDSDREPSTIGLAVCLLKSCRSSR